MSTRPPAPEYLALDELQPRVDLASYWRVGPVWYTYRIPGHHLLLIHRGTLEAETPQGRIKAKDGDLICFRPTEHNEYGTKGKLEFFQAHIDFAPPPKEAQTPWLGEAGPLPLHLPMGEAYEPLARVYETLMLELPQSGAVHELRVRQAVFEMLALIAEAQLGRQRRRGETQAPRIDAWQRARLRLGSDLDAELRLGPLARELGVSRDHFIRRFRQRFGVNPIEYRTRARLLAALRRLREGTEPVKTIARALGWADTKSLTRACKRHFGLAPRDVRAGQSLPTPEAPGTESERLYPINKHVVPPEAGAQYFEKWRVRK
ncbi:MAG: helix-turn-helix transcriptional regulator [Planctomycetes bacterium]|nr:helix-turn-helix transcriptional regulator [Planctomycetota bacterium]